MGTLSESQPPLLDVRGQSADNPIQYPYGQLRTFLEYFRQAWNTEEKHYFSYANHVWLIDPETSSLELVRLATPTTETYLAATVVLFQSAQELHLKATLSPEVIHVAQELELQARLNR